MELTDLPNVGPTTAQKLRQAGYPTVESLKGVPVSEIQKVDGIGRNTAEKIAEAATFPNTGPFETVGLFSGTRDKLPGITEATFETEEDQQLKLQTGFDTDPRTPTKADPFVKMVFRSEQAEEFSSLTMGRTKEPEKAREAANAFMSDFQKAQQAHQERSPEARRADEAKQAERLNKDFETWSKNKDHLDFPGVDTP